MTTNNGSLFDGPLKEVTTEECPEERFHATVARYAQLLRGAKVTLASGDEVDAAEMIMTPVDLAMIENDPAWIARWERLRRRVMGEKVDDFPPELLAEKEGGHLMTVEEWLADCKAGGFIDYDGYCSPIVNANDLVKAKVYPSERHNLPKGTTHVLWYNR